MLCDWHGATGAAAGTEGDACQDVSVTTCPACGDHVAILFYDGGEQPLATLGWPASAEEALSMARLPLRFVRCTDCGHVFNAAFDYGAVPYKDQPNRMFNRGVRWSAFLEATRARLAGLVPQTPTVVEIGHGDASFLEALAAGFEAGQFYGFDPHGATQSANPRIVLRRELFTASQHLSQLRPHLLLSRHVLEHLSDPLGFIQSLGFAAARARLAPLLYLEVPCIDRALAHGRIEDFYYEHNSHFTTASFSRMIARSGCAVEALDHGYNGEVVFAVLRLTARLERLSHARQAAAFREMAAVSRKVIQLELAQLHLAGKRVAFWGGTGKCAAFFHAHQVDAGRFPLVVDSDPDKVGTYVPGSGQRIQFRDALAGQRIDVLIVPSQWRAGDIAEEAAGAGICYGQLLIPHNGRLVDYFKEEHPYKAPGHSGARQEAEESRAGSTVAVET